MPRKYLIVVVVVAALAFWFFCPEPLPKLEFAKVKKQDITTTVSASGVLTGKNSVSLNFPQGGRLAFMNVKTGRP